MLETKRKRKRNTKKKIIKYVVGIFLLLIISTSGYFLFLIKSKKALFITPLSRSFSFSQGSGQDKNLNSIKKGADKLHLSIDKIITNDDSYNIFLTDKSEIIFSNKKDINSQLASLQFILARLTMEGKLYNKLDLRFDKPVIAIRK